MAKKKKYNYEQCAPQQPLREREGDDWGAKVSSLPFESALVQSAPPSAQVKPKGPIFGWMDDSRMIFDSTTNGKQRKS